MLRVTYICRKVLKTHENDNTSAEQCGCLARERQVGFNWFVKVLLLRFIIFIPSMSYILPTKSKFYKKWYWLAHWGVEAYRFWLRGCWPGPTSMELTWEGHHGCPAEHWAFCCSPGTTGPAHRLLPPAPYQPYSRTSNLLNSQTESSVILAFLLHLLLFQSLGRVWLVGRDWAVWLCSSCKEDWEGDQLAFLASVMGGGLCLFHLYG